MVAALLRIFPIELIEEIRICNYTLLLPILMQVHAKSEKTNNLLNYFFYYIPALLVLLWQRFFSSPPVPVPPSSAVTCRHDQLFSAGRVAAESTRFGAVC